MRSLNRNANGHQPARKRRGVSCLALFVLCHVVYANLILLRRSRPVVVGGEETKHLLLRPRDLVEELPPKLKLTTDDTRSVGATIKSDTLHDVPSLQDLLRIAADNERKARAADVDADAGDREEGKGKACTTRTESTFSPRNDRAMAQIMRYIKLKKPWGWIRFADGDMNDLCPFDAGSHSTSQRLMAAIRTWPTLDNLVVSVGSWWLCQDEFKNKWNQHMRPEWLHNFTFHDQCFYLPMGTPDDDDRDMWEERGIRGWVRTALESDVPMVLVSDENLRAIPWLANADFVSAKGVATEVGELDRALRECERASASHGGRPVLFVLSAGSGAKTIITELMSPERKTNKDMFIDAGTSLDGFAGVQSRDFNSGAEFNRKYCKNTLRRDPENVDRWLAPGVCQKERDAYADRAKFQAYCHGWRQTGGCDPLGKREMENDARCSDVIESGRSGYCECVGKSGRTIGASTCKRRESFTCGAICMKALETKSQPNVLRESLPGTRARVDLSSFGHELPALSQDSLLPPLTSTRDLGVTYGGSHSVRSWSTPRPIVLPEDLNSFKVQKMAFDGCAWEGSPRGEETCIWPASEAHVSVHLNASLTSRQARELGICGHQGKDDIHVTHHDEVSDNTIFVPIDVAQAAYFAHFIDCAMPKLVYALDLRRRNPDFYGKILVYLPREFSSPNTHAILEEMRVEWTQEWPFDRRFRAIVWVCKTPSISPLQGARMIEAIHGGTPRASLCSGAIVYAARSKGVVANGRIIDNNDELVDALKEAHGHEVRVLTGRESIAELRGLLGDACFLIGEHGTALSNMVYLPRGAYVVELDGSGMYTVFWTLANVFGLRYGWLNHQHDKTHVDVKKLHALIRLAQSSAGEEPLRRRKEAPGGRK